MKSGDPHECKILAVSALALGVLPPALLEGNRLRPSGLFDNLTGNTGAFDKRGSLSRAAVSGQHENMIECHAIPGLAGKRHNGDRVPSGDAILLAAGFDNCEQLTTLIFHAAQPGEESSVQRPLLQCRRPADARRRSPYS
jgi:hypothetical protein